MGNIAKNTIVSDIKKAMANIKKEIKALDNIISGKDVITEMAKDFPYKEFQKFVDSFVDSKLKALKISLKDDITNNVNSLLFKTVASIISDMNGEVVGSDLDVDDEREGTSSLQLKLNCRGLDKKGKELEKKVGSELKKDLGSLKRINIKEVYVIPHSSTTEVLISFKLNMSSFLKDVIE